jgi:hypothetical protein
MIGSEYALPVADVAKSGQETLVGRHGGRFNGGGIARLSWGMMEVALTEATHRALPVEEGATFRVGATPLVYSLLHLPRAGDNTIAAHPKAPAPKQPAGASPEEAASPWQ